MQLGQRADHRLQLLAVPRVRRRAPVDRLEGQGDPVTVVVDLEQAGHPRRRREHGRHHGLPAMQGGRLRVEPGADRLHEDARTGRSRTAWTPRRESTVEIEHRGGRPAADLGRPRMHCRGHLGPGQVDAGRRAGG